MHPLVTDALALGLMMAGFVTLTAFGFTLPAVIVAAALYGMGDDLCLFVAIATYVLMSDPRRPQHATT